ncbi:hypothetical protein TSAR_008212 [Trichomalopsis sarcophagae]|uniref:Phorbol-ester/DAG-type domain-containing protein n=1 Tax=Trichomalopsis sarcophagae TaxID=543379 RepID=A0A232ERR2_9HYME|nr:hypothetical protein TSAR_008212 [Trichomalopsis sarcophagae]
MPVCRRCSRNAVSNVVVCNTCSLTFHEGCLARFASDRVCKPCCAKTYGNLSLKTNSDADNQQNSIERAFLFDLARDLNPSSLLDVSDLGNISNSSIISQNPDYRSTVLNHDSSTTQVQISHDKMALPSNWKNMSTDDKLAEVFCMVATGTQATKDLTAKTDSLVEKINALTQTVDQQRNDIVALEKDNVDLHVEVNDLKQRLLRGRGNPEINKLNLAGDLHDIFDRR